MVEWKNAVFLWVNVGEDTGYTNLFEAEREGHSRLDNTSHGRDDTAKPTVKATTAETAPAPYKTLRMTWFAGNRMTAESALIRRLVGARPGAEGAEDGDGGKDEGADEGDAAVAPAAQSTPPQAAAVDINARAKASEGVDPAAPAPASALAVTASPGLPVPRTPPAERTPGRRRRRREEQAAPAPSSAPPGSEAEASEPDTVLLFCRLPKEPYVFCGRLAYAAHWPDERPVRFAWRLLDAERLADCPDFRDIAGAAGIVIATRGSGGASALPAGPPPV